MDFDRHIAGRVHSLESFGAVDGPGVRFVVFMQGCPLRCLFCHNPDSWNPADGQQWHADDLCREIVSYKNFIRSGGVTLSGGEPLMQVDFCASLLRQIKEQGLHTAIDTSGAIPVERAKPALEQADMLLLDMKAIDTGDAKTITGLGNENAKATLQYCEENGKTVWLRHVLVPGYTLDFEKLEQMADYLKNFSCIETVELLPFHKMGEYKWETLKQPYLLTETPAPDSADVQKAKEIFLKKGLRVR